MRFGIALAVLCACGRLNFDAEIALAITSPIENAPVPATVTLAGTCKPGIGLDVLGSGLLAESTTSCDDGAFSVGVTLTPGDGPKLVTVRQGAATASRTLVRVNAPQLRAATTATKLSEGFTIDCDLTIPAPAGLQAGDLLLGMIYSDGGGAGSIATPGFTPGTLTTAMGVAFFKIASATEPEAYVFRVVAGTGVADTCESAGVLAAFANISPATPVRAQSASSALIAPGLNSPAAGILVGAWGSNGPATGIVPPPGMQMVGLAVSDADFANALIAFEVIAAGPTGDRTATTALARGAAAGLFVLDGQP